MRRGALKRSLTVSLALAVIAPATARPQGVTGGADSTPRAPSGSQFLVPLGSLFLPGFGQYRRGAVATGAAFTATAVAGYVLYVSNDSSAVDDPALPRHPAGQRAFTGALLLTGAGMLSAYDAFRGALPALQREGRYRFVTAGAETATLLTAPFDPAFLTRWTTWLDLAYAGAVAAIILSEREPGRVYEPYKGRDAAFITALSLSAGAGEEAMFRGWLMPVLYQTTGERMWLANGAQAVVFGGLHIPQAGPFALVITVWALYEGWVTRRNGWNVRESVFHHFWYDAIVGTATFLADERGPGFAVRFPTIRF